MGLQSAMTTALTGLKAAETTIDVVGNNVANANTVAFKESGVIFATQFLQTQSIGSAPSTASGGTNPRQIGLGVQVAQISPNFNQGTIEISSNPLDVAIQGDGFLIVQGLQGERLYTRNGQLNVNSRNELTTASGQRVLGYTVDDDFNLVESNLVPLRIPLGEQRVAQATTAASFTGVLNPDVARGETPEIIESAVLGNAAIAQPDDTNFTTADITVTEPSTPPALTDLGGVGPTGGLYRYRVVFRDANGLESAPTSEVSLNTTATSGQIELSSLPTASGSTWVDRVIYRTDAGGTVFKQLAVIPDANTTTTYTDTGAAVPGAAMSTNTIDTGSFSYYVTYYNPSEGIETRPTSKIGPFSTPDDGRRIRIDLSDLAPPGDASYTKMRIYRNTSGDSTDFRRLTELDAPGTSTFIDSYMDSTDSDLIAANAELNLDGPPANSGNRLTELLLRDGASYTSVFAPGTLTFSGKKGGVETSEKTMQVTTTSTVQDLIDFMRDSLGIDQTSSVNDVPFPDGGGEVTIENGRLVVRSNIGEKNAIAISLTSFTLVPEGSSISQSIPISFTSSQTADGPGTSTEFVVYDSLGLPLNVRITTVLESGDANSTTYRWFATSGDSQPSEGVSTVVGDGILVFDSNGALKSSPANTVSVLRNDIASESPLSVSLDFSRVKSLGEVDGSGKPISRLSMTVQDGFPPGVLTEFIVTESGLVQGQFSNGTQRTMGQLVMARFANNSGLSQVGDSLFSLGVNSGEPVVGTPGEEGIGTIKAGAVELSNTDIGQNLIDLILASTQYRGGSRVISAAQELLDELLNLRR